MAASEIQVQTDNAGLGEVVTGEQVRELPLNGRSFVQLTQLQPGVSAANSYDSKNKGLLSGVDFSVNGNSYTSNLFLIDGANNNDTGSNRTILLYPSIEAISEFKMLRNSYGAEYGMAAGAVINIVTKSGTNQWHGDVLYFGRNTALNAWDYFAAGAKAQDPNNPFLQKQVEQRNDYGFSIGGPIKKDKLFVFYSQEWNKEKRGNTRDFCVPSVAERNGDFTNPSCGATQPANLVKYGLANPATPYKLNTVDLGGSLLAQEFPLPNLATPLANGNNWVLSPTSPIDWSEFNVRVDYNLSHANTLMFRWTQDSWTNNSPEPLHQPVGRRSVAGAGKQLVAAFEADHGALDLDHRHHDGQRPRVRVFRQQDPHYSGRNGPLLCWRQPRQRFLPSGRGRSRPSPWVSPRSGVVLAPTVTARTCG